VHRLCWFGEPSRHLADSKHHLEMLLLGRADDVKHQIGPATFDTVDDACEVTGGVVEPARARLNDQRQRVAITVGEPGRKHDLRTIVLPEQPRLTESLNRFPHERLIEAFAGEVVIGEEHAEL